MRYNFDEIIDRKGTDCVKWDGVEDNWGRNDLLPMWVADMDFKTPPFIIERLRKRLEHEVLGYTMPSPTWKKAIINWVGSRHGLEIKEEEITFVPGIVRGLAFAINCLTQQGDKVMVMDPVYHPFFLVPERNGRKVVHTPLDLVDEHYAVNFQRFKEDIKGCTLFILCNPHNPGGRVWTQEELSKIAEICQENGTLIISDEIHADLTLPPFKHHTFSSISEVAKNNSITFMAPSKAFNMPGLSSSYAIIRNKELRERFNTYMDASELDMGNMFAYIACEAAYNNGTEWLDQMLNYVKGNIDFTENYLKENIPTITMIKPQASYLIYIDCRKLNLPQEKLVNLFVDKAHLALNDGTIFGVKGKGFMRLNVGCPRSILGKALDQLKTAVNSL